MSSKLWRVQSGEEATRSGDRQEPRLWRGGVAFIVCMLAGILIWGAAWTIAHVRAAEPPAQSAPASAPGDMLPALPQVGHPAPDFTLTSLAHGEQSLSQWRGQPVLINFWATWCGPCRREMPELVAAYERYQAEGLVILAVNLSHQDVHAHVEAFVEEFQVPFPVLLDVTGEVAHKRYGASGLPMSVFIDRDGTIRHIYLGALNRQWLEQLLMEIL